MTDRPPASGEPRAVARIVYHVPNPHREECPDPARHYPVCRACPTDEGFDCARWDSKE